MLFDRKASLVQMKLREAVRGVHHRKIYFFFDISLLAQRNIKERAPRESPWNPSAAAILKMTAVDVVSLTETPACHNSGSRVAEGKRT